MRYTHRKRGPKKTYGRKRHYRKKTIKRVGGGCLRCLPPSLRNKYNFKDSDTSHEINEKLKRWIINQDTPFKAREHMAQSWAAYLDHDSGDIRINRKRRMEQRVRKLSERLKAARVPVANEEMTEEEMTDEQFQAAIERVLKDEPSPDPVFDAKVACYLKQIEEEQRYEAARNSASASL
jgi:hypothetical protein